MKRSKGESGVMSVRSYAAMASVTLPAVISPSKRLI